MWCFVVAVDRRVLNTKICGATYNISLISNNICYNFKFHAVKQSSGNCFFYGLLFVDATRTLMVYADARVRWLHTLLNFPAWNFSAWRHFANNPVLLFNVLLLFAFERHCFSSVHKLQCFPPAE